MIHDAVYMRRALALAARAYGRTAPNPMVGCVLVRGGRVVAEGFHRRAGLPHAEVEALRRADGRARGATAFVTLEPCNHVGRTGPCTEVLIAAGVKRVVAAMRDPNPHVAGHGARRLRAAGIPVDIGLLGEEAAALNRGYLSAVLRGRPLVTLKVAVSLDGRIAASSGDARWITGPAARREAHRLRDRADAVVVGAGTVIADDPMLTTRLPRGRDPLRVVLDGRLATPANARLARAGTLVVTTPGAPRAAERRLVERGVDVVRLAGRGGRVDLRALLAELGRRGALEVLVEGGAQVHGDFLAAGLVDRVVAFVAPVLIGAAGVPLFDRPGAERMADALRLRGVSTRRLGDDMMFCGLLDGEVGRQGRHVHRFD